MGASCLVDGHAAVGNALCADRDLGSLIESPAAGSSEVLLLEGHEGHHLNPTQSRFSRFASNDTDLCNAFGVTSSMFRNSSAGQALRPGFSDVSVQQADAAAADTDSLLRQTHALWLPRASQGDDAAHFVQHGQQELDQGHTEDSLLGSAGSCQFQGSGHEALRQSPQQHSHSSSAAQSDGRTRISTSAYFQQPASNASSPEAPANTFTDHNFTDFAAYSQEAGHELMPGSSMSHHMHDHGEVGESSVQYSWSAHSQSYAGSAGSPGRDSLHSWVDSTPVRPPAVQDPASPDTKTILRSLARDCQHHVEGRSPAIRVNPAGLSPQSKPDLSRTPNTFFNPSFDADKSP